MALRVFAPAEKHFPNHTAMKQASIPPALFAALAATVLARTAVPASAEPVTEFSPQALATVAGEATDEFVPSDPETEAVEAATEAPLPAEAPEEFEPDETETEDAEAAPEPEAAESASEEAEPEATEPEAEQAEPAADAEPATDEAEPEEAEAEPEAEEPAPEAGEAESEPEAADPATDAAEAAPEAGTEEGGEESAEPRATEVVAGDVFDAIALRDPDALQRFVDTDPSCATNAAEGGQTPLHLAACLDDAEAIAILPLIAICAYMIIAAKKK